MDLLITDIDTFKLYYEGVNKNMTLASITSKQKVALRMHVNKYIDAVTYAQIIAGGTPEKVEARELLSFAVAHYTVYEGMPGWNMNISDMGATEQANNTNMPISQWRFKNARWTALQVAENFMDQTLDYIIKNKSQFTSFVFDKSVFFTGTNDFKEYSSIVGRRAFLSILPHIREAESELEEKLSDFYTTVKGFITASTPHAKEVRLVDMCKRYIAHNAMARAIPRLMLYIDGDGVKITSSTDGFDTKANVLSSFGKDGPDRLMSHLRVDAKTAYQDIENYLYKNKDHSTFTAWYDALPKREYSMDVTVSPDGVGAIGLFE